MSKPSERKRAAAKLAADKARLNAISQYASANSEAPPPDERTFPGDPEHDEAHEDTLHWVDFLLALAADSLARRTAQAIGEELMEANIRP